MCGILDKGCAPSMSEQVRQPQSWELGESFSQFSPNPSGVVMAGRRKSSSISQHKHRLPAAHGLLETTLGYSDPSSPGYLLKLLQMSSAMVKVVGKSLSPQPNHPTQPESLDSNYPSLWYNLSYSVLYSWDPMPGPLFPRHLHPSCLPTQPVACPFSTSPFVPSTPHVCHFNSQLSISVTADTKIFTSLILQFPIPMYTEFSTAAHCFIIPYFEQF